MKIYLTAIIKTKSENRDEMLAFLQNMVTHTQKEKACIQYTLHQGLADRNIFVFYEIWENRKGLEAHNQQPYILEFTNFIKGKLQDEPQIHLTQLV